MKSWKRIAAKVSYGFAVLTIAWPAQVLLAAGTDTFPDTQIWTSIQAHLQGPTATILSSTMIGVCGFRYMTSDHGMGAKALTVAGVGAAFAIGAPRAMTALGLIGGALI